MIQRIALLVGGLGAAAVLAFALGLVNFASGWPANSANSASAANTANAASVSDAGAAGAGSAAADQGVQTQTKTVYDKVYIAPAPPPKVIHVAKDASSHRPSQTTQPAPRSLSAAPRSHDDGEDGSGHERESDDGGHHGGDD